MKAKIENFSLVISLGELFDGGLSDEDCMRIAQSVACNDAVIDYVAEQILGLATFDGWSMYGNVEPITPLDKARRRLIERVDLVSHREIEALKWRAKQDDKTIIELKDKIAKLEGTVKL